jgi:hypothetical protein
MDVIGQFLIVAIYAGPSRTIDAGRPIVWQDFQSAHVAYGPWPCKNTILKAIDRKP